MWRESGMQSRFVVRWSLSSAGADTFKMNILLVIGSLSAGGAERVAVTLVNAWAERGDTVTLVSTYSGRGECFYALSEKVKLVYLADLVGTRKKSIFGYSKRLAALRKLFRDSGADVIVSFLLHVNVAAIAANLGTRIPIIVGEHSNPLTSVRSARLRLMARILYPRASALTVLTEGVVAPFESRIPGLRRVTVMPNPIPAELMRMRRTAPDCGRKRLVAVGRLLSLKQFDVLIEMFASVAAEFSQWDLYIWGDGPQRPELETLVREYGLKDRVMLAGSTQQIWHEMSQAHAFALTSRFEGLPMSMMEAMTLGLPCVAFDCPSGPKELTRDGKDGLLVPAGDRARFTQELRRVMSDASLRESLGNRAAKSARARYSLANITAAWDRLFEQCQMERGVS
jgi:GalNAc-alpha-(1->4)-GalNAc-alpha-(1->3)-diNAcBac-PP-undecaprenol alpha-1,4-N-acetyl-D-galactosaminyltransferase